MTANLLADSKISDFTLALLEGTGWYQVNYEFVKPMTYGKNAGCEFFDTKCVDPETQKANFKEFCSPLVSQGVSFSQNGFGFCGTDKISQNPSLIDSFDYWGNKTVVADKFADNCPHTRVFSNVDCEDSTLQSSAFASANEYYGFGAKGFVGTLSPEKSPLDSPYGYCFLPKVGGGLGF